VVVVDGDVGGLVLVLDLDSDYWFGRWPVGILFGWLGGWVSLNRFLCYWCCGIFWSLFVCFSADR
jgi:hypothetical protein